MTENDATPQERQAPDALDRPQFYAVKNLAARWRVSEDVVRGMVKRGEIEATRIGRSVRVARRVVDDFEARMVMRPGQEIG